MKYETLNEEMAADPELIPELMEYEQEYNHQGVNRPERDYIRWIQRSLNQILGLRLPVNGVKDPYTRSAVRGFQLRKGLPPMGLVVPETEAEIIRELTGRFSDSGLSAEVSPPVLVSALSVSEQAEFRRLSPTGQEQFKRLRRITATYTGVALRESEKGLRTLLHRGFFRLMPDLLPMIFRLANNTRLPAGWNLRRARPLLVGNVLYNLAFPETINQGGYDRKKGKPDPTCFSACVQILLAIRKPVTYVEYIIQLASASKCVFLGRDTVGPLVFRSTSLYKSLDSVLLQTAFDTYFRSKARSGMNYSYGDELKVFRQVFGPGYRVPTKAAWGSNKVTVFREYYLRGKGHRPELINICTGNPAIACGNHSVVLTRIRNKRVYFYNPWANEEEKGTKFGNAVLTVSGHGERPAESSMTLPDFEGQISTVFYR